MVKKQTKASHIEIYRAFINRGVMSVDSLAKRLGVSRFHIYKVVKFVEEGNDKRLKAEAYQLLAEFVWKAKYKDVYAMTVSSRRKKDNVEILKKLIINMVEDGLSIGKISEFTGKHRTTIIHHLK